MPDDKAQGGDGALVFPEIRWIGSLDHDDPEAWRPEAEAWQIHVRMLIGPRGEPGEESFDLTVCSVPRLAELARSQPVSGEHMIVVESFQWSRVQSFIEKRVRACSGNSWDEVAVKLSRFARWEFEDHS